MKTETYLFTGVAFFFGGTAIGYAWWSNLEPAGTAALIVSFLMSTLICLYLAVERRKYGSRPEDHKSAEIKQRSGPVNFFPSRSIYPAVTALGYAVAALGVVYGLWLFLIGLGILAGGVFGFTFQFVEHEE